KSSAIVILNGIPLCRSPRQGLIQPRHTKRTDQLSRVDGAQVSPRSRCPVAKVLRKDEVIERGAPSRIKPIVGIQQIARAVMDFRTGIRGGRILLLCIEPNHRHESSISEVTI